MRQFTCALWALLATPAVLVSTPGAAEETGQTIDAFEAAQQAAWNAHDAGAYTASVDADAEMVSALGWHWHGQAEAATNLGKGFGFVYARAHLRLSDIHARFLTPDLVSVTMSWSIDGARTIDTGLPAGEQHGFETQLLRRSGQSWSVLTQQDTAATSASAVATRPTPAREAETPPAKTFPTTPPPVRRCIIARGNGECMLYGKAKPAPSS